MTIPIEFVLSHVQLNWREASWAYKRGLIDWRWLSELAVRAMTGGDERGVIVKLAGLTPSESVDTGELASALADSEPPLAEESIRDKWFYVALLQLYNQRECVKDPLSEVESLICDFDHPLSALGLLRYMPVDTREYDPRQHSTQENEARLLRKWKAYLDDAAGRFGPKRR